MNARDRWLVNLGFDAGWTAHEQYVDAAPDPSDPTDLRVSSFDRVSQIDLNESEVYEHIVVSERADGEHVTVTSICGKVWKPSIRSEVSVVGRCPDCAEHVKASWVA